MASWNLRSGLFLIGLSWSACVSREKSSLGEKGDSVGDNLRLDYSLTLERPSSLRLSYAVTNTLDDDIYIFTPLTDYRGGEFVPIPERIYVFWADSETIHLTKRLWPVPKDREVYMPEVPYLTQLKAGQKFEEKIDIPLPLLVNSPYREEPSGLRAPRRSVRAVYSIGYFRVRSGIKVPTRVPSSGGPLFRVGYGEGIQYQSVLEGMPVLLAIPAHD